MSSRIEATIAYVNSRSVNYAVVDAEPSIDVTTPVEAAAIVANLHCETLGVTAESITSERADAVMQLAKVQTTTELLLLLARFHADVDDSAGANMLAAFAVQFAAVESATV